MRIFLIGMPGSGKSYWMRKLAQHQHCDSLDLDVYITTMEQQSIAALFEIGEAHFRERETLALRSLTKAFPQNMVIATGGGAPFFHENMEWMKENGIVVYLEASVELLFKRLKNAYVERPLLRGLTEQGILEKLAALYEQRKEIYQQAHHIIPVDEATLATFVATLYL
jgi:shikimate kinase